MIVNGKNWSSYAVKLEPGINHVMFIYFQSMVSLGYVQLNNLRVCGDRFNEATCSSASGYYNTDDLAVVDDPAANATLDTVCSTLQYSDYTITYANRVSSDVVFKSEADRLSSSKATGGMMESRQGSGAFDHWAMLVLFMIGFMGKPKRR